MAYAALISLGQILDQILDIEEDCRLLADQKVKYLRGNITFLETFLEEYSQNDGEIVHILESRIRDAAYQATDIIESHISRQSLGEWRFCYQLNKMWPSQQGWHHQELRIVLEEIDLIVEEVMMFMSSYRINVRLPSCSPGSSSKHATNGNVRMVGFDEDLMQVKALIYNESSKLQTISVVGMGGIGKTTLVKNIYTASRKERRFDKRAWTAVSQNYNVREILLGLLDSMKMFDDSMLHESTEKLSLSLYKCLKSRRYLVVLDDMWDTKAWDDIRNYFPDDGNGSRILLTTRLSDVAVYANSSIHPMHLLDLNDGWVLLTEIVFPGKSCPTELEEIGKKIVASCGGLPLAICLVAGLLSDDEKTVDHWESIAGNIAQNKSAAAIGDYEQLSKILSLSYNHLPRLLKACFLYLGIFPEDYEISKSKLIKLWVAEGFLKPMQHKRLEEIAEECIEDLANRSLIIVHKRGYNGKIKTCGIHDILRDLCVRKATEDELFHHIMERNDHNFLDSIENRRRLSILVDVTYEVGDTPESPVRSILYFGPYGSSLSSFYVRLRLLKVLDAASVYFDRLPVEIVQLVHLTYLAFTLNCRGYHTFSSSITKLQNLQTLIVHGTIRLRPFIDAFCLPVEFWEMSQLRHVSLFYTSFLSDPSSLRVEGNQVLENLQTLYEVTNFKFTKKAIRLMRKLKKLAIVYGGVTLTKGSDYGLNNLHRLRQLEKPNFSYRRSNSCNVPTPVDFTFPRSLKKLTLSMFRLPWDHITIVGSLPNLEKLKLLDHAFCGREWQPIEGQFSKLLYLSIDTTDLELWRAESSHFPRLERLQLYNCTQLEGVPVEIGEIPTLRLIELKNCNPSTIDSAEGIQEEQQCLGNDVLKVRVYS